MRTPEKPDVKSLMKEIERDAAAYESGARANRDEKASWAPPLPASSGLEEHWDVWDQLPVTTHRGLIGLPVVWLKRLALFALRPHNRELLKGQRQFNLAAKTELEQLRRQVVELRRRIAELTPSPAERERVGVRETGQAVRSNVQSQPASATPPQPNSRKAP